ncbi:MAG: hypothetical protein UV63_C0025G0002 [Microgenomates group bacterium GW2011_GWC1_43_11]|nr:MAG: hypothetical protein UV63_C0025G0002 [Microgenomates group bacterium GW2011_GWC1_43_11]
MKTGRAEAEGADAEANSMSEPHIQTVRISGITCGACVRLITRKLSQMEEVDAVVSVDLNGLVHAAVNKTCTEEDFEQALTGTLYTVESIQ